MDLTSLKSEIRHPVDPTNKRSKLRSELPFPVRLLISSLPDEVLQLIALADIGCQVMAGTSVLICKNLFVHSAEFGDRIRLGYAFFLQYRLGFLLTKKFSNTH